MCGERILTSAFRALALPNPAFENDLFKPLEVGALPLTSCLADEHLLVLEKCTAKLHHLTLWASTNAYDNRRSSSSGRLVRCSARVIPACVTTKGNDKEHWLGIEVESSSRAYLFYVKSSVSSLRCCLRLVTVVCDIADAEYRRLMPGVATEQT